MKNALKYLLCTAALFFVAALSMPASSADEAEAVTTDVPVITAVTTEAGVQTTISAETATTDVSDITTETTATTTATTVSVTEAETTVTVTRPPIGTDTQIGWNKIDNKWFYYNGESFVTGVVEIDGEAYLFAENGALRTGWQTVGSIRRYYDYETHSPLWEWVEYFGKKYYVDKKVGKLTGMQNIDDKAYIFSKEGVLQTGFVFYEKFMYYCDENDGIYYGDEQKTPVKIDDNYYFISPKGYVLRGWQTLNGLRIFYDYDTGQPVYGWIEYNGNYYYTDTLIGKHTGVKYINTHPYRFNKNGVLCWGLQYFEDENAYFYFYKNGERAVSEIVYTAEGNYYFDKSGKMKTGWVAIEDKEYYFLPDGKMALGFQTINGGRYYFDSKKVGAMHTGFLTIGKNKYYFNSDGIMQYGFIKSGSKIYYFDLKTGIAVKGWITINNKKYYFDANGEAKIGWQNIEGKRYYFDSGGVMLTNQRKDNYVIGADGTAVELKYMKAADVLDQIGWDLQKAFRWASEMTYCTYKIEASYGINYYAEYGFNNKKGNCYVMAAVLCEMARTLGYNARQISGSVPLLAGGYGPHSWVEITENGTAYVYDPDFTHETGRNGYRISYGMSGTWVYVRENEMKD